MTSSMTTDACVNRFFANLAYFHMKLYLFENRYFKIPCCLCYDNLEMSATMTVLLDDDHLPYDLDHRSRIYSKPQKKEKKNCQHNASGREQGELGIAIITCLFFRSVEHDPDDPKIIEEADCAVDHEHYDEKPE